MLDEKINKMVEENLNIVPMVVWSKFKGDVSGNYSLLDEYIGIGNEALIEACQRFDETLGYAFSTYASSIIWGKIQRFRREKKNSIKLPHRLLKAGTEYNRGVALNKDINTICEETGVKKEDIEEWLSTKNIINLDTPIQDSEGSSFTRLDMLADDFDVEEAVLEDIKYQEKMAILEKILKPKELEIVKLIESGVYKQIDMAKKLDLSQSYISRIIRKLTENVGPVLEKYYSGEINLQEFCETLKIKEDIFMNFEKEIDVVCQWLISNPGKDLNLGKVLKEAGMARSSYQREKIRNMALDKMVDDGYYVKEVPYGAKGTRLMLCVPGQGEIQNQTIISNIESKTLVEEGKVLLNLIDIPIANCDLEFTEALQKSLSMFAILGKIAVLDIKVREVS